MISRVIYLSLLVSGCLAGVEAAASGDRNSPSSTPASHWNRESAAAYLDGREVWWETWPPAQRDYGTICISCHTAVPYAMARPGLRRELHESGIPVPEKTMMANVEKRVTLWNQVASFYSDSANGPGKTAESRATEAVLNAVMLAGYDAQLEHVRPITRLAFDQAWALQLTTGENSGGWKWQDFHLAPWESAESAYQGAALFLVKVSELPDGYANEPGVRNHVDRLRAYLQRQYSSQPVMNQLYVLWASARTPGLLSDESRKALIEAIATLQLPDGGWSLAPLDKDSSWKAAAMDAWQRIGKTAKPAESDGYATALVVLALEKSDTGRKDPALRRGLEWLESHQGQEGSWRTSSLNKQRDPSSDVGRFMSDAATGYAVLALENAHEVR